MRRDGEVCFRAGRATRHLGGYRCAMALGVFALPAMPPDYFIPFVVALASAALAVVGVGFFVRVLTQRLVARRWAALGAPALSVDEKRGRIRGVARVVGANGTRIVARPNGEGPRIEGRSLELATEDGRRYRVELAGVSVRIDAAVAEDCARQLVDGDLASVWTVEEGDVVELRGRVAMRPEREGYREPAGAAVLQASEPGKLDVRLRRRAIAL